MNFIKYFIAGKDYLLIPDKSRCEEINNNSAITLCNRTTGIGADGIFTFQQNNGKNIEISGLSSDGQIMRDFSSASICACFDIFSKTDVTNFTFSFKNQAFSELNCDFSGNNALISYRFHPVTDNKKTDYISKRTEIGNRILTVTAVELSGIHGVHFSECKNNLNINYLGAHFSRNSLFNKQGNLILAEKTGSNTYEIDFYENGTGNPRPTLAAYSSVAIAACKVGLSKYNSEITLLCNKQSVKIIHTQDNTIFIRCLCRIIFEGFTDNPV